MDGFREVYERHYRAVYQMALFLTGAPDQAEDLAADTFVRAWMARDRLQFATVRAYLLTITRNLYRDRLRAARRFVELEDGAGRCDNRTRRRLEHGSVLRDVRAAAGTVSRQATAQALLLLRRSRNVVRGNRSPARRQPQRREIAHRAAREIAARACQDAVRVRGDQHMNVTREVIYDLLPAYFAGEASADTRALVEEFFATDAERRIAGDTPAIVRTPASACVRRRLPTVDSSADLTVAGSAAPLRRRRLGRVAAVARGAGARRSHEQLLAVGERDVAAVRPRRPVLALIAVDDHFGADRERVLGDAAAQQRVRRAALDHPHFGAAAVLRDLDVDPRVRVHELDLDDLALEEDRPVRVELRAERVVRDDRHRRRERQRRAGCHDHQFVFHQHRPFILHV